MEAERLHFRHRLRFSVPSLQYKPDRAEWEGYSCQRGLVSSIRQAGPFM